MAWCMCVTSYRACPSKLWYRCLVSRPYQNHAKFQPSLFFSPRTQTRPTLQTPANMSMKEDDEVVCTGRGCGCGRGLSGRWSLDLAIASCGSLSHRHRMETAARCCTAWRGREGGEGLEDSSRSRLASLFCC